MVANASRPKRKIKLRFIHFSSRTCFDLDAHKSTPSSQRFSRRRGKCSKEMASKTRNSGIAQPLECVTLRGSDGSPHTCYKQSSGWLFVGSDLFLSSGRGTPALQWKSGASAPLGDKFKRGFSPSTLQSATRKGCRLHRCPSTLRADAYPIAVLRRTAARLNPGAAIKQIQHNRLVSVRI